MQRVATMMLLGACGSADEEAPTDTSAEPTSTETTLTGTTASGSSTATGTTEAGTPTTTTPTGTTTTPTTWGGTYSGTLHVDIEDIGFVVNHDTCDAPLTWTIDETATPQITGSTTCYPTGILSGQSLHLDFQGSLGPAADAAGVVDMQWTSLFAPNANWSAAFSDSITLEGAFFGQELQGSAGFSWDATFTLVR